MFVHDRFVCLQLQKCASVRIGEILREHVGGQMRGHHERIDIPLGDRKVIASIRDPWSWYVSLWAFGCKGSGGVRYRLTEPPARARSLPRSLLRARANERPLAEAVRDFDAWRRRDPSSWEPLYADVDDPELFRAWLRRVLDPAPARVLDPHYGSSGVARVAGLLTWRYLRLYVRDLSALHARSRRSYEDLVALDQRENVCTYIMRIDRLAEELLAALAAVGCPPDDAQREAIVAAAGVRSNVSRHRPSVEYYDAPTVALVAERERLIVDKHGYDVPRTPPPAH